MNTPGVGAPLPATPAGTAVGGSPLYISIDADACFMSLRVSWIFNRKERISG